VTSEHSDVILERLLSLHPKIIDLTLTRMWSLLDALGNPERSLPPVVHIAGTNGKGSTLAMIRAGIEGSGQVAHAYTSPHLARFHERIRVSGELIDEGALQDVLEECERANLGASITYFEITTCAAILAFSRAKADFTLFEVGLGGRLDATNVIETPKITVITPVSFDHPQYLGNSVREIAFEKAGILKRGVPCVVGPQSEDAAEVIEKQAAKVGAPLIMYGQHWHVWEENDRLVYQDETGLLDLPLPNLIGAHQVQNAGAAIAVLRHLGCNEAAITAAVSKAEWPARMQRLKSGSLIDAAPHAEVWLDGGHNAAAGQALAEALGRLPDRNLHLVCGMLNTKDVEGYMRPLAEKAKGLVAVSIPCETATLTAEETAKSASNAGFDSSTAPSVEDAARSISAADPKARILVCGSLYLAGHVLRSNA
jgi:dihydrofolate synthase/folylpolyglutamate synthase